MDSRYIQQRTDNILRQRIALGATGGRRPCPKGRPVRRKAYTRADGKKIASYCVRESVPKKKKKVSMSKRACPKNKPVRRRAYTRADGKRVAATCVKKRSKKGGYEDDFYGEYDMDIPVYRGGARKAVAKKPVAKKRTSPWIAHVKKYAAKHKISYACALSEASKSYR